jgi:glycosyltransferase involved in cell wall biosynthesis
VKKARNCTIVIPAYNEAENLPIVIPQIIEHIAALDTKYSILIIDDGSSDGTADEIAKLVAKFPKVTGEAMPRNLGKAAALKHGFATAVQAGAEIVIMMDADGQDDPAELETLLNKLDEGFDLVTGARYTRNDRFIKRTTSKLYNATTSWISGVKGKDFNSGFKVMRAPVAEAVGSMMYGELHRYLTVIASWHGYRITEVHVTHHQRLLGKSKYGIARFWRGFIDLLTIRFLLSYENRPSHLIGGLGIVSLLVGGGILVYLSILRFMDDTIGNRPILTIGVLFVVVGVQLILFGLLAELLVFMRHRGAAPARPTAITARRK